MSGSGVASGEFAPVFQGVMTDSDRLDLDVR
jgi:hypothetical protein